MHLIMVGMYYDFVSMYIQVESFTNTVGCNEVLYNVFASLEKWLVGNS